MGEPQFKEAILELTNPEYYEKNGDLFPVITHERIVNMKFEIARPYDEKNGYAEIWIAKCYIVDNVLYEAPGLEGKRIYIDETDGEIFEFADSSIGSQDTAFIELCKTIWLYLIEKGYVDGTLVIHGIL